MMNQQVRKPCWYTNFTPVKLFKHVYLAPSSIQIDKGDVIEILFEKCNPDSSCKNIALFIFKNVSFLAIHELWN